MKLASFNRGAYASYGCVEGDCVRDLGAVLGPQFPDLRSVLVDPDFPARLRQGVKSAEAIALTDVVWQPVIPNPSAIWCVGLNYREHVEETHNLVNEKPVLFLRTPASQTGHLLPIVRPPESPQLDFEGEIAVVIGRGGRRIAQADAYSHIAGYACYNDGSVRDWQQHSPQWAPGKNFSRTGAFGPWMVTADEIEPDAELTLVTRINGTEVQRATTRMLIHGIPRLIAYISTFTELQPGDVIVTGTPGGIGAMRKPPLWLRPGDTVEVEVDRIGVLVNPVADENASI